MRNATHKTPAVRQAGVSFCALLVFLALLADCAGPAELRGRASTNPLWLQLPISKSVLTTRDGLAGNFITALAQAPDGGLWIGTTTGVTRVEAGRWTTFTHLHGLGSDWVTSIAFGPDGRAWFSTYGGGLAVFDGQEFKGYTSSDSALPGDFITALAFAPDGTRWLACEGSGLFHEEGESWRAVPPPPSRTRRMEHIQMQAGQPVVTTGDGVFRRDGAGWVRIEPSVLDKEIAAALSLDANEMPPTLNDGRGHILAATPRGLAVFALYMAAAFHAPAPRPVVLVHGWTVAGRDELQDSEFRFLASYAEQDGIPVFYANGLGPQNTLWQNAARLRDEIARVRQTTGADKVNLLAFSMGGLNARAYLESSLYQGDVNRLILLGTPEAGVDIWKPVLAEQILAEPGWPSAIELTPEYARLLNQVQSPRAEVPYDLLVGDARQQPGLEFVKDLPPADGLIGVRSGLALDGPNVRRVVNADLHAFEPVATPFQLTSYLYPRDTYERYFRNALRDPTNAPLGSEVNDSTAAPSRNQASEVVTNHTPVVTGPLRAGETAARTIVLDANRQARFLAYYPGGAVHFELRAPDGRVYRAADQIGGAIALKADLANLTGYAVEHAAPGMWTLTLKRTDQAPGPLQVTTYADLDADRKLTASASRAVVKPGEPLILNAMLTDAVAGTRVTARIAMPSFSPGGAFSVQELPLAASSGGAFAGFYTPTRPGYHLVQITAAGPGFARGTEFLFAVSPESARLGGAPDIQVSRDGGSAASYEPSVKVNVTKAGAFAVAAALRDADRQAVAHRLQLASLTPGSSFVRFSFAANDLIGRGPYTLDLMLLDTTGAAIPVDEAQDVATLRP